MSTYNTVTCSSYRFHAMYAMIHEYTQASVRYSGYVLYWRVMVVAIPPLIYV